MRKALSFLLAIITALSSSIAAFAQESPTRVTDSQVTTEQGGVQEGNVPPINPQEEEETLLRIDLAPLFADAANSPALTTANGDHYGSQLSGVSKQIYDDLKTYFTDLSADKTGINMAIIEEIAYPLTQDEKAALVANIREATTAIIKDTSLLYWVNPTKITIITNSQKELFLIFGVMDQYDLGANTSYPPTWYVRNVDISKDDNTQNAFAEADRILEEAQGLGSDYEKVQYFNKAISQLTSYDNAATPSFGTNAKLLDVFAKKPTDAEGYATALKYLCDEADIGCLFVEGTFNPPIHNATSDEHAWNVVELDGKWYIVDVANNDASSGISEDFLAIGTDNTNYVNHYSPITTLNVVLSNTDFITRVEAEVVASNSSYIDITFADPSFEPEATDVTVAGRHPDAVSAIDSTTTTPDTYRFTFTEPLAAGTYDVELSRFAYVFTLNNATVTVGLAMPAPEITFGEPDENNNVTVVVTMPANRPDTAQAQISCSINGVEQEKGVGPRAFNISPTSPDDNVTKTVVAVAHTVDGYEKDTLATNSYTYKEEVGDFQVVLTPVADLKGPIAVNSMTQVATISTTNVPEGAELTITIDESRSSGFVIVGDKILAQKALVADTVEEIYVNATMFVDSQMRKATAQTTVSIGKKSSSSSGSSGGGGGGGGGSSSSDSSSSTTTATNGIQPTLTEALATEKTQKSVNSAVEKALSASDKQATADINVQNTAAVSTSVLAKMTQVAKEISTQKNVTINPRLVSDIVVDGSVQTRLYIEPAKSTLTGEIKLGVSLDDPSLAGLFQKYYENKVSIVKFEQANGFGMPVQVATKLNLTGMDVSKLVFYHYDMATNQYAVIEKPEYYLDSSGYIHFTVTQGDYVLVSDGTLTLKK